MSIEHRFTVPSREVAMYFCLFVYFSVCVSAQNDWYKFTSLALPLLLNTLEWLLPCCAPSRTVGVGH